MAKKTSNKQVLFVILSSGKSLTTKQFTRISKVLEAYSYKHGFKLVLFNSIPGRPIELKYLEELYNNLTVYEINFDELGKLPMYIPPRIPVKNKTHSHTRWFDLLNILHIHLKILGGKIWKRICQDQHLNRKKQN